MNIIRTNCPKFERVSTRRSRQHFALKALYSKMVHVTELIAKVHRTMAFVSYLCMTSLGVVGH